MKKGPYLKLLSLEGVKDPASVSCQISLTVPNCEPLTLTSFPSLYDLDHTPEKILITIHNTESSQPILHTSIPFSTLKPFSQRFPLYPISSSSLLDPASQAASITLEYFSNDAANPENIFENSLDAFESFASELALVSLIDTSAMDSQELIAKSDLKKKFKKQELILKVLIKQIEVYKERLGFFHVKVAALEKQVIDVSNENLRLKGDLVIKEKEALEGYERSEAKMQKLVIEKNMMGQNIRSLQNEKEHLLEKIEMLEFKIEKANYLENELENAWLKVKKSEEVQEKLNKAMVNLAKSIQDSEDDNNFHTDLALKDQEVLMLKSVTEEIKRSSEMRIFSLKMEIEELKQLLFTSQDQERQLASKLKLLEGSKPKEHSSTHSLDSIITDCLKKQKIFQNAKKLSSFSYQFRDKIVNLALTKQGLFAIHSNTLTKLEEFLEDPSKDPPSRDHSPGPQKSDRSDPDSDPRSIKKSISQQSFLKGTKSSLSKIKPIPSKSFRCSSNQKRES